MNTNIKRGIVTGAISLSLLGGSAAGVVAQNQGGGSGQGQAGGAAGLVAAVAQIAADDTVNVQVVDSLNNLTALNNILNNSPILSSNDVDVTVGDVTVLENFLNANDVTLEEFLNENDIALEDIVSINVLSTDDIIVFV
jgi:hypothetical protein